MNSFSKDEVHRILANEISPEALTTKYPQLKEAVLEDIANRGSEGSAEGVVELVEGYKSKATYALGRIQNAQGNRKTINRYIPEIIKARIAIYMFEQLNIMAKSGGKSEKIRFNLWDGFILQKLLFKKDLVRKQASIKKFKLFWPLITNKKILMPLVNKKGIYCFYSKESIRELAKLIGDSKCVEIGAGDGTLTRFLTESGVNCTATDDYSWKHYIQYPDFVENLEAKMALKVHRPEVVICSWAPPGNSFEKSIFETDSVKLYIAIGTNNPVFAGNHQAYENQTEFELERNQKLADQILPCSKENMVYVFRRK